jgi:hypothetical protein
LEASRTIIDDSPFGVEGHSGQDLNATPLRKAVFESALKQKLGPRLGEADDGRNWAALPIKKLSDQFLKRKRSERRRGASMGRKAPSTFKRHSAPPKVIPLRFPSFPSVQSLFGSSKVTKESGVKREDLG